MNELEVKGSYFEVGKQIGMAFKQKIKEYIEFRYFQMKSEIQEIGYCQTAHCGRGKPHFDFGNNISPIVRYRHLPQTLIGMTVDCCSLV